MTIGDEKLRDALLSVAAPVFAVLMEHELAILRAAHDPDPLEDKEHARMRAEALQIAYELYVDANLKARGLRGLV